MTEKAQLRIDLAASAPAYRQIVDQLRTMLVEGTLAPGEALPSVRRIAIDLGVHFNTVAEAYRTLSEEGWLDVSHGKSVRVRERAMPAPTDAAADSFRVRLRQLVAEVRAQGLPVSRIAGELTALAEGMK